MYPRLLLIICCMAICTIAPAQENGRAAHFYNAALKKKAGKDNEGAYRAMEKAVQLQPGYIDAYSTLGQWYFDAHRFGKATDVFRAAYGKCKNGDKLFAKPLAKSLLGDSKTDSALLILNSYAPAKNNSEWQAMRAQAIFIQKAMASVWKDTVYNMGVRINTSSPEFFPSISADTQTLYFTRSVHNMDQDFYFAVHDSCGGWLTAENMGTPPNTPDQESAQVISADGHYLFFTRCENRSENGWDKGGCDLFMAYRIHPDSAWSVPQSFGGTINSPAYEGMPCLSPDNRELYFVSNRDSGYGGLDIWVSRFEQGMWQAPMNLGPSINTAGDETAPFIHIDNKTLYFTSNGHPGMGGSDLYTSKKINDTTWTAPVNMGYPINTTADEVSACVTTDGQELYFASDRDSAAGNYDLYHMHLPTPLQPQPVSYLEGYVYDSLNGARLNYANIYIKDASTGNTIYQFQSNRGDGSFMITLPGGRYTYTALRVGYSSLTDTFNFSGAYAQAPEPKNIAMLPENYVKPIHDSLVATINFANNSAKLSDTNVAIIQQAMLPWVLEKDIVVLINGYTDNTGTPIMNEQLSYQRAGLVMKQLATMGISEENIKSQGWGEARTIATNDTEDGRARNRRVEVIIRR